MTWSRFSDDWPDCIEAAEPHVSMGARWHLHQLIARCSRTQAWDGILRLSVALRVSDVDHAAEALTELRDANLIEMTDNTIRVVNIDSHVLPPSLRPEAVRERQRQHRARQEENSRQSDSIRDGNRDTHSDRHKWSHSFPGTHLLTNVPPPPPAAVARIARLLHRHTPEDGTIARGQLRKKLAAAERHLITPAVDYAMAQGWLAIGQDGRIQRGAIPA